MKKSQQIRKVIEKKPYINMNIMGVFDIKEEKDK